MYSDYKRLWRETNSLAGIRQHENRPAIARRRGREEVLEAIALAQANGQVVKYCAIEDLEELHALKASEIRS